jgi:hypothetical protein
MQRVSQPKGGAAEPASHRLGKWFWCRKLSALPKQKDNNKTKLILYQNAPKYF